MKASESKSMRTVGGLTLCRSLLNADLVDRFRVVVFPVITGSTGRERIYDSYPDVALDMISSRTLDGRIQLLDYGPTVLSGPPVVINTPAEAIFAVLADPLQHATIDGTGWVREALDPRPLTAAGQIFRMSVYHPGHPNGTYQMANRVQVFDHPNTISWEPGNEAGDGSVSFPGWSWRYDLTPAGPSNTTVTLPYDWSAVPDPIREHIGFSSVPPEHLGNSLTHLAELLAETDRGGD